MEREQFTFYKSFAKAIQKIRKAADRAAAYDAVVNYALDGSLPDLDKLPDSVCIVFELVRPNLDASRRKAQGGKNGRKTEDTAESEESSEEDTYKMEGSSEEDTENKKKDKKEGEDKKEDKKEEENECSLSPTPSSPPLTAKRREELVVMTLGYHGGELLEAVRDWTKYKIEKRQGYKETGYKSLLTQIEKKATEFGDEAVVEIIRQSMSSNYDGILLDRLGRGSAQKGGSDGRAGDPTVRGKRDWNVKYD